MKLGLRLPEESMLPRAAVSGHLRRSCQQQAPRLQSLGSLMFWVHHAPGGRGRSGRRCWRRRRRGQRQRTRRCARSCRRRSRCAWCSFGCAVERRGSPAGLHAACRCLCSVLCAPLQPHVNTGRPGWCLRMCGSSCKQLTCVPVAVRQDESERLQQIAANQALQTATGAAGKWAKWGQKKGAAAGAARSLCACSFFAIASKDWSKPVELHTWPCQV
jgi:hypothetical protein